MQPFNYECARWLRTGKCLVASRQDYSVATSPVKPRNMIASSKTLAPEEMERLILANTAITPDALNTLAQQRADTVRDYLEKKGEISNERLFLIAPKLSAEGIKDKGQPNRVDFSLK